MSHVTLKALRCDRCGTQSATAATLREARQLAEKDEWVTSASLDLCGPCTKAVLSGLPEAATP
jgi:hypothetical protein